MEAGVKDSDAAREDGVSAEGIGAGGAAVEAQTVGGSEGGFEPRVLVFCCNWCSYAGADLAGVSRIQYPPNVRIVRVMCSGRVEPSFVLRALEKGADGVLITGCHIGDCHYLSGNEYAERRIARAKQLAELLGLGGERVRLEWVSASEGARFAQVVGEFVGTLRGLGPNPLMATPKSVNPGHR